MTEREGTAADFARLFGKPPDDEQDEAEPKQTEAEEEPSAEDLDLIEADPVDEHNRFLADLFAGSAEKRKADAEFLALQGMQPPDEAA